MREVYIVDGVRTPIGRMEEPSPGSARGTGRLRPQGLIEKTKIDPAIVEDVLIGHACTNNAAVNIAAGRF